MITWSSVLTVTAWLGPFVFIALFYWLEKSHPRVTGDGNSLRLACISFGIIAVFVNVLLAISIHSYIVAAAYQLRIVNVSAWPLPIVVKVLLSLLIIDFMQYWVHVISHKIDWLWRFHKVHHADPQVSAPTGLLHHPVELLWIYPVIVATYVMAGLPIGAILIYGALAAFQMIFAHTNLALPSRLNSALSLIFVTPDTHRVHHSTVRAEADSNYGVIFTFWDRLFRTFISAPKAGHTAFQMGLIESPIVKKGAFMKLLKLPLSEIRAK